MDKSWLIYTLLTIFYIIILVIYFLRRSKSHEKELTNFLDLAQQQLETHKLQADKRAEQKVSAVMAVVKKIQQATVSFEGQVQSEYEKIIDDAQQERRELLAKTKTEIEQLFKQSDKELDEYKTTRQQEIEKNLVKLVIAVTEKVVDVSLSPTQHKEIIMKALEEIKQKQARS
jgi:F0F1-type ATP synthase membrane subunit b/b'